MANPGGGTSLFSSTASGVINGNNYSMTITELGYDNGGVFQALDTVNFDDNFNGTNYLKHGRPTGSFGFRLGLRYRWHGKPRFHLFGPADVPF